MKILFLSQALNAVLLLAILPFLRGLARDPAAWASTGSAAMTRSRPAS